jgi:hypothetical protein
MFKKEKCKRCEGKLRDAYSFCPYCGLDLRNYYDEKNYGMLGKSDNVAGAPIMGGGGLGITDKMVGGIFNSLMKNLEKQMKNMDFENMDNQFKGLNHEVQRFPNGIRIKVGGNPQIKKKKVENKGKVITDDQVKRMSKLPRSEAKADVRRFSDRVVYELKAPEVEDVNDIFVSKLETGYEVKAIGKKKVYVNSLPVNLPLKRYFIKDKKLCVEFGLQ